MAIDKLINSTQGDSIIEALGSSGSIAQSLAIIAAKSNTPYNSDNKLNPSFIAYDTTHAAVTEAQRTQIGTNTTNITWNTNNGVKNYLPINSGATTGAQYVFDWVAKDIPAGQYIISFSTATASGAVAIEFGDSNTASYNQTGYRSITLPTQSAEVTIEANTHYVRLFANTALTITDIMLRPASISDASYQPYALPNAELTSENEINKNNILSLNKYGGGKNKFNIDTATIYATDASYTKNSDGTINVTKSTNTIGQVDMRQAFLGETGTYIISGCPSVGSSTTYEMLIQSGDTVLGRDYGEGASVYLTKGTNYQFKVVVRGSQTLSNKLFKPMISVEGGDYQPYAMSNAEITAWILAHS